MIWSLHGRRGTAGLAGAAAVVVATAVAAAGLLPREHPGPQGDGTAITPVGQRVTPAGSQLKLEERPYGMALSPDGARLLVSNAGVDTQSVMLVDVDAQEIVDEVEYESPESSTLGVAFSPDGSHAYVSAGPNNAIRAFKVDESGLTELNPISLTTKDAWPAGISVSDDGRRLYVAGEIANALLIVDVESGRETRVRLNSRRCPALQQGFDASNGHACNFAYATALAHDGATAYVSNWGKRSVSVVDTQSARLVKTVRVGTHPSAMALNPVNDELYVANSDSDSVSVIDTDKNRVVRTISVRPYPGAQVGTSANALAVSPDGKALYVANAGNNDVAVVELAEAGGGPDRIEGLIPTAWYPTGVAVSPEGGGLYVVNAKGLGAGPNPGGPVPTKDPESAPGQYIGSMIEGTLSTIAVPDEEELAGYTQQVAENNDFGGGLEKAAAVLENIKHVIYVINENRTYDQVLGDLPQGNGDPSLTLFGSDVAPNHHKLAQQFTTLDNLYAAGESSNDGWEWSQRPTPTPSIRRAGRRSTADAASSIPQKATPWRRHPDATRITPTSGMP
ncbi:MAG: bifunctional YncE family protein/alkaline phosphatase family protein [Actinobacteria bacterium]|nr:bifunctional YncE family protein/alkaline phosphatase family protein [Actinomycetota bacterium]